MIEQITVKNFKSLADVSIDFGKFNCFVGLNGAGKTTILQALDFISQQMRGDIQGWLQEQGWAADDIRFWHAAHAPMPDTVLEVRLRLKNGDLVRWSGRFDLTHLQLVDEVAVLMSEPAKQLLSTTVDRFTLDGAIFNTAFNYQGSVLSQLRDKFLPEPLRELKKALVNMRSLYLLAPHLLRRDSRPESSTTLSPGGDGLPSFLHILQGPAKERLEEMLKLFYPRITGYKIMTTSDGAQKLAIHELQTRHGTAEADVSVTFAGHVNDGLLRVLAILAQLEYDNANILVLDEIENGINPEITEKLVDLLVRCPAQIIITTHSPMILNYVSDEIAKTAVQFVFKDQSGQTSVKPFFSLPATADKLVHMGPGEAFVDTNLNRLTETFLQAKQAAAPVEP